eukprot:TRINITY_DN43005_c0_g1_i1.p2 TRINITY_DN43005_c0_g1~~TRINITY_DN43005_c0_g1_i1.p2  ORF type:complete len:107 (-),score=22.67 TRINITY_DN43005_c0_g1_i1:37-357(-)
MISKELDRIDINERNKETVSKFKGTNREIEFANHKHDPVSEAEKIKIQPGWTTKKIAEERFFDTHKDLFQPAETSFNPERARKLRAEQTKGRKFDIISGAKYEVPF